MIQVQVFSHEDEEELEESINDCLKEVDEVLSIQFQMNHVIDEDEVLAIYSAIVVYRIEE